MAGWSQNAEVPYFLEQSDEAPLLQGATYSHERPTIPSKAGKARECAEGARFELARHFCPPVFKTGSIGRSDSPPGTTEEFSRQNAGARELAYNAESEGLEKRCDAVVDVARGALI